MHKRNICVITGSRAEYGLLYWLMRALDDDPAVRLQMVVTGSHLEKRFGLTYKEIVKDKFNINKKVYLQLKSDTDSAITRSVGMGVEGFGGAFAELQPDIAVILGDRFEMLAAASAALLTRIPIAHIHGGEVTEGVYDDSIRHAITKMSYLHFVAHKDYAKRVVQLGEDPRRVFNVGAIGLDNIKKLKLLSKRELGKELKVVIPDDFAIVTFHPETMEKGAARRQIGNLLHALHASRLHILFTLPNADAEHAVIFKEIKDFVKKNPSTARLYASLGRLKYLSLMKHATLMIGNSSSGIIEAPSFKLPVVNIGTRQYGRIRSENIIDCSDAAQSIARAVARARSQQFKASLRRMVNPFGDGSTSAKIKKVLTSVNLKNIKKRFYNL